MNCEIALGRDELGPYAGLDPQHVRRLFGREAVGHRFPCQHLGDRLRATLIPFPRRARLARPW